MPITLPTEKIKAARKEPKLLIVYSLPKTGKTSSCAALPNSLLLDLENRSDEIDAVKFDVVGETKNRFTEKNKKLEPHKRKLANNIDYLKMIYEIGEEIKKANNPYKFLIVDSVTKLEDWCEDDAEDRWIKSPLGKDYALESILMLDYGKGYDLLRKSFIRWVGYLITLAPTVILLAHVKPSALENNATHREAAGGIVGSADLDLTGKIRRIACAASDAIGFMYRKTLDTKGNTMTMLTFKNSGEILCGSPYKHLNDKTFEFGKMNEKGRVEWDWPAIFPSLKPKEEIKTEEVKINV